MKRILFSLAFFALITPQCLLSQIDEFQCGVGQGGASLQKTTSITTVPSTGTVRILVILCKFNDDNFDLSPHTDQWPASLNAMPSWGPNLVSTSSTSYVNPSLTGYFDVMSNGNYSVIGDVYFYQPQFGQSHYSVDSGRHVGHLTEEILRGVDAANPGLNFANYDNDGNSVADMIKICFRFADGYTLDGKAFDPNPLDARNQPDYQGIAGLGGFHGTFVSSSTITLDGITIDANTISGSGTFQEGVISLDGALGVMAHEYGHYLFGAIHYEGIGYHGLMDGNGSGVMSSFERENLGWVAPVNVTSDTYGITLTDAISTHCVYRVDIPGSANHYFLVDNHQRVNFYESTWRRHNGGPLTSPGTGLLITHVYPLGDPDIESAFGRWDWQMSGGNYVFPFAVDTEDATSGEYKHDLRAVSTTSGDQSHPDYLGSQSDYFTEGGDEIFYPWSNPNTSPNLTDVAIEIVEQSGNNIEINIHTSNAPPAKPQNLTYTNDNNHPKLMWNANIETDLDGYEIYRSYDGGAFIRIATVGSGVTEYTDTEVEFTKPIWEKPVKYKIKAKDTSAKLSQFSDELVTGGIIDIMKENEFEEKALVHDYALSNHPNPFNPSTKLNFSIPEAGNVKLMIFNVLGQKIAELVNTKLNAGSYSVGWNGDNQSGQKVISGIYFSVLRTESKQLVQKMILSK